MENAYISENRRERIYELIAYSGLVFAIPLFLGHLNGLPNQLFVGTAVNALLAFSALRLSRWKRLPVVLLPSIGAYLSGAVFGAASPFLLYFIPFIWAGNFVYTELIARYAKAKGMAYSIGVSSIAKSVLLFAVAYALVSLAIVPEAFLTAMGVLQLGTAIMGGLVALLAYGRIFAKG